MSEWDWIGNNHAYSPYCEDADDEELESLLEELWKESEKAEAEEAGEPLPFGKDLFKNPL